MDGANDKRPDGLTKGVSVKMSLCVTVKVSSKGYTQRNIA